MFENCKAYNRPDSKLYRDGVRLQKVMHSRLEELYDEADIVPPVSTVAAAGAATTATIGGSSLDDPKKSPKDPREPLR
jgi:protein polybromo-1